jgi:hypothetical protein
MAIGDVIKPHPGGHLRAEVLDWYPSDSRDRYLENIRDPEVYQYFQDQGWLYPGTIQYRINSEGFRGDEFDPDVPNLVALGDSFTFGIGLPEHTVWPWLLGKRLDLRVHNLALGGASADRSFALAEYWLPRLKPQRVYMATPCRGRLDIVSENCCHQTIMHNDKNVDHWGTYYKSWIAEPQNSWVNNRRNEAAVAGLCHSLGIPVWIYRADECFSLSREEAGYARDRLHAGPPGHEFLVENMLGFRSDYRRYY